MTINAGCGWSKTKEEDNSTYISGFFSEDVKELFPQLSKFNFILRHVSADKRQSEKSPHWVMDFYIPRETENKKAEPEIPKE